MTDKRKCYKMENGYCRSDFSFYNKYPESVQNVDMYKIWDLQREVGSDEWFCVGSYTYVSPRNGFTDSVIVLQNVKGVQIETSGYGWYSVETEYEKNLKLKKKYEKFLNDLSSIKAPDTALENWQKELIDKFKAGYDYVLNYE